MYATGDVAAPAQRINLNVAEIEAALAADVASTVSVQQALDAAIAHASRIEVLVTERGGALQTSIKTEARGMTMAETNAQAQNTGGLSNVQQKQGAVSTTMATFQFGLLFPSNQGLRETANLKRRIVNFRSFK
jgi:signal transduction histidine kinase